MPAWRMISTASSLLRAFTSLRSRCFNSTKTLASVHSTHQILAVTNFAQLLRAVYPLRLCVASSAWVRSATLPGDDEAWQTRIEPSAGDGDLHALLLDDARLHLVRKRPAGAAGIPALRSPPDHRDLARHRGLPHVPRAKGTQG